MAMLQGKTALITGALGTIGLATVNRFLNHGVKVIALDRPEGDPGVFSSLAGEVVWFGCDLNNLEQAQNSTKSLCDDVGGVDFLVNNAALIINKPHEEFTLEEYEQQLRVNAASAFALVRAVAPKMKTRKYGKIVNLTSLTLNGRWDGYVPYVASKGAMLGLTKGLARELGPFGINVNAVAPGAVVSEAEERVFGEKLQEYNDWIIENQSLKARIQPEDVASLVLFLCSNDSRMISGQNIGIDAGW